MTCRHEEIAKAALSLCESVTREAETHHKRLMAFADHSFWRGVILGGYAIHAVAAVATIGVQPRLGGGLWLMLAGWMAAERLLRRREGLIK